MKLRMYLANLVIAVSTLPTEARSAGKHKPAPTDEDERRTDPLPYGTPSGQQVS